MDHVGRDDDHAQIDPIQESLANANRELWAVIAAFGRRSPSFTHPTPRPGLMGVYWKTSHDHVVCETYDAQTMTEQFRDAIAVAPEDRMKLELSLESDEFLQQFTGKCASDIHHMLTGLPSEPRRAAADLKECMLVMDEMKEAFEILSARKSEVEGIDFTDVSPIVNQIDALKATYQNQLVELGRLVVEPG